MPSKHLFLNQAFVFQQYNGYILIYGCVINLATGAKGVGLETQSLYKFMHYRIILYYYIIS